VVKNYQWLTNNQWKSIFYGSRIFICPTLETIAIVKTAKT
jgi:hypothetical protein